MGRPPKTEKLKYLSFRISTDLKGILCEMSEKSNISMGYIIRMALKEFFISRKNRTGKVIIDSFLEVS